MEWWNATGIAALVLIVLQLALLRTRRWKAYAWIVGFGIGLTSGIGQMMARQGLGSPWHVALGWGIVVGTAGAFFFTYLTYWFSSGAMSGSGSSQSKHTTR